MEKCRQCNRPIESAIEGELICELCWELNQMTPEERAQQALIEEYLREQKEEAKQRERQNLCFVCEEPMDNSPVGHKCWYLAK